MLHFLFVSRHEPTQEQIDLAEDQGVLLHWVGDLDAFAEDLEDQIEAMEEEKSKEWLGDTDEEIDFSGVVAVHGLICATAARMSYKLGFFRNTNRAGIGEKPDFHTDLFVIYSV